MTHPLAYYAPRPVSAADAARITAAERAGVGAAACRVLQVQAEDAHALTDAAVECPAGLAALWGRDRAAYERAAYYERIDAQGRDTAAETRDYETHAAYMLRESTSKPEAES